ncbi:hypothetical protein [Legionella fairfieldensis]|uniref:hypothetical protein n=1 Tax=Legionella fairfieldensis TaxID=45064 RepID=UPI001040F805|nr:hypothetical protein [Legionella fairfieldensis]
MHTGKNKLKISEYLAWIIKKYQDLHIEMKNTPAYRIEDIKITNGVYKLMVQINGTGKIVPLSIYEILNDDLLLKEFSPNDIRTIHHLGLEDSKKPNYIIVSHKFSEKKQQSIFILKNRSSGDIQELTAAEIFTNKKILKQCSPVDAFRVGYIYRAEEQR